MNLSLRLNYCASLRPAQAIVLGHRLVLSGARVQVDVLTAGLSPGFFAARLTTGAGSAATACACPASGSMRGLATPATEALSRTLRRHRAKVIANIAFLVMGFDVYCYCFASMCLILASTSENFGKPKQH